MHRRMLVLLLTLGVVAGCGAGPKPTPSDSLKPPKVGACRQLSPPDLDRPTNDTPVLDCAKAHNSETFAVGTLPDSAEAKYDDKHGAFVYRICQPSYQEFLGVDDSLALRIQLSWAWFRPSKKAWANGARWYRCDLIGRAPDAAKLRELPETGKDLFAGRPPDEWTTCAVGATVAGSRKVPCSETHDWRAVTAIKIGQPDDPYPGDAIAAARSRDRCSDWVGAWLNYEPDYEFGYTWFHEAEWKAGNRRSVCWAKTAQ